MCDRVGESERGADPERDRLELTGARLRDQFVEIEPGERQQLAGGLLGGPRPHLDPCLARVRKLELLAGPGVLDNPPAVPRRGGGVDDDGPRGARSRRTLVLVAPTPVVEAALPRKQRRVPVGVVVHDHEDLALQVGTLEVVPAVLRRLDAVAHEHELCLGDGHLRSLNTGGGDELVPEAQGELLAGGTERPRLGRVRGNADDLEALLPTPAGCAGLQAEHLHHARDVVARQHIAPVRGCASLQQVVGQEADRPLQGALVDDLCRLQRARGAGRGRAQPRAPCPQP